MGPGGSGVFHKKLSNNNRISCCSNEDILLHLKQSWSVDDPINGEGESVEDGKAKAIMDATVLRTKDGHYQLGLLWKDVNCSLPSNKLLAETRLSSLKRKLEKNKDLLHEYAKTVDGYIEKGYAEPVFTEGPSGKTWHLPHHPVVHPQKGKLRVVFDCAAKWRGISLNECLMKGPDTINSLVGVLLRFRQERIALVADVEAMFHQAKVIPEDRDVLRFLWWPGGKLDGPPSTYRMAVHLFGATSSPACAGYALQRAADNSQKINDDVIGNQVIMAIKNDFYVDDLLTSTSHEDVAVNFVDRLRRTLKEAGFKLAKWFSNSRSVLNTIPASERAPTITNINELPTERTLGVCWDAEIDKFKFKVSLQEKPFTRRGLLSSASQIFDPLGFGAPFILIARSLLQSVCRKGCDWDEQLSVDELSRWKEWLSQVPSLSKVEIPRWIRLDESKSVELHIFCDASMVGYAAVAYLRVVDIDGVVRCLFVLGKARVSPMKSVSIPRLELMAAILATSLSTTITTELRFGLGECTYWTDSMIVLGYIQNETRRFKTFVANRVSKIRDISSPQQWRHVGSKQNPADDGSRGTFDLGKWLSGPEFLLTNSSKWPTSSEGVVLPLDPEVKKSVSTFHTFVIPSDMLERLIGKFSSLMKLVKVFAWIRSFINNCRRIRPMCVGGLSVSELDASESILVSYSQKSEFKSWQGDQRLVKLKPVLLSDLLRVGGRLDNSDLSFNAKHPIILSPKGPLTNLIIRYYHESVGHGGLAMTLNAIRQKFWLVNGRSTVKGRLSKCVVCRKLLARPAEQEMARLPLERVSADKPPFCFVGVDYFGPIEIKRGRSLVKRYGCIFTCLASRAVHLEVSASLDTDSFLNAFRRFVARRGEPEKVFSDNGTNFQAGEKELRQALRSMNDGKIESFFHNRGCEWHFNPPSASHYGGAWERLIRSVRRILYGILGQQTVNEEVLTTVFTEVESILNSRPLTDVSFDPKDDYPITPNHLILLRQGPGAPVSQGVSNSFGRRRWLQVQHLASTFWLRWRKEYLPLLQKRQKWTTPRDNVMEGDIVLLTDETVPRGKWPLGKVTSVRKSSDGKVRSVEVKVRGKQLRRPITKLCIVYRSQLAM
ncbi:uncharacterized protein [Antedon mediterranea]|uniref:uncharacterized protein n=1 Tax=Antedon mediterranea TaxID=105859 RepID=UPI003AF90DD4